jgi:hypothetical protein
MSTVLGISQTTPPPRWPRPWVDNIIETYNSHRPPRMRTTVSLPALPDPAKPGDNRFKPNKHVPVTESSRLGWVPTRKPDANLHALMLHRKYPKIGCHETRSAPPRPRARARRETHIAARRFQHSLILNGSVKDDAWFKTSVKSEFSSHMAYLKR